MQNYEKSKKKEKTKFKDASILHNPELEKRLNEFKKETPRGAAIVAHAQLEDLLKKLLMKILINTTKLKSKINKLSFEDRVILCFSTGAISKTTKNDLLIINDIRNKFAHEIDINDFDNDYVSDKCNNLLIMKFLQENLKDIDFSQTTSREKYMIVISNLWLHLENWIRNCQRIEEFTKPW